MKQNSTIILFQEKQIRRVWYNEQWYFSIVDVLEVLTDSAKPRTYWAMLKKREPQLLTICEQLKMTASDNKNYKTDASNLQANQNFLEQSEKEVHLDMPEGFARLENNI
jgi:DNA-damage-inducible protein D